LELHEKKLFLFPELSGSSLEHGTSYYEQLVASYGYKHIAGIDEAGRGPLAGPVVAAAVILGAGVTTNGIRDSKAMTEKARNEAFRSLTQGGALVGIGVASPKEIDKNNILNATLQAMRRAVTSLPVKADYLLVDGVNTVPLEIPQKCIVKGDRLCLSISAASIVAKVYRDRIMYSYHQKYPQYGFDRNKGYGTKEHMDALKSFGPCPIHRLTFRGVS